MADVSNAEPTHAGSTLPTLEWISVSVAVLHSWPGWQLQLAAVWFFKIVSLETLFVERIGNKIPAKKIPQCATGDNEVTEKSSVLEVSWEYSSEGPHHFFNT